MTNLAFQGIAGGTIHGYSATERVIFCKEEGGIIAIFPHTKWDQVGNLTAYDGQHGWVSQSYFQSLPIIQDPREYLKLKNELLSLGYKLEVLNDKPSTILRNVLKTK